MSTTIMYNGVPFYTDWIEYGDHSLIFKNPLGLFLCKINICTLCNIYLYITMYYIKYVYILQYIMYVYIYYILFWYLQKIFVPFKNNIKKRVQGFYYVPEYNCKKITIKTQKSITPIMT